MPPEEKQQQQIQPQVAPVPAQSAPAPSNNPDCLRTLYIYHATLNQRTKRVCPTDKKTTLYTFTQNRKPNDNFGSRPHVRIYNGSLSTGHTSLQGFINLYGNVISLEFEDQSRMRMSTLGSMTTRTHEYKSVALPARTLKWRKDGWWSRGDWLCEDQHGEVVARLKRISFFSTTKTGTFGLGRLVEEGGGKALIEIVAGGIGLIELQKKQTLDSRGVTLKGDARRRGIVRVVRIGQAPEVYSGRAMAQGTRQCRCVGDARTVSASNAFWPPLTIDGAGAMECRKPHGPRGAWSQAMGVGHGEVEMGPGGVYRSYYDMRCGLVTSVLLR